MDMNRLIGMLTRMFIRSATDAGIDYAARKGKPEAEMTPEERKQARAAKDMANRLRQTSRLTRRFFR
jgi:hypothetical protein